MRIPEDPREQKAIADVEVYGWHVMKVLEDSQGPGFAYTIGLHHSFKHPELIIVGLPADVAHSVLNIAGDAIRRGERFRVGQESNLFLEDRPCMFRSMPETQFRNYLGWDLWFYDGSNFQALQIVWSDQDGRWPWDVEAGSPFAEMQPVIENQGDSPWAQGHAG